MIYHFKYHKSSSGFWATCSELPGCQTQAESMKSLQENASEALNAFLDEPPDSEVLFSLPRLHKELRNIIAIKVDPQVAFAFYLRRLRKQHKLTQKEVATRLGFNNLYSYQRLESSKTANPQLLTLNKIKSLFRDFDLNELLAA